MLIDAAREVFIALALLVVTAQQSASNPLERLPDLSAFENYNPYVPPSLRPLKVKTTPVTGRVVLFDSYGMNRTSQMDLFIKVEGKAEFLRLRYCPYSCGFDAPAPTPEMVPPREMITDGRVRWTFDIVPVAANNDRFRCGFPMMEVPDGHRGHMTREYLEVYKPPDHASAPPPDLHTPACFTVISWSRAPASTAPGTR